MNSSILVSVAFPIVLGLIMFGLGTSLRLQDFQNLRKTPRAMLVGLGVQIFAGPLIALMVIQIFSLSGNLAFGLLLLAAVPGGSTSNLFSHLAGGDVALNVSLTALNSILALVSIPMAVFFLVRSFWTPRPPRPFLTRKLSKRFASSCCPSF